jgi:hypothetical protein
MVLCSCSLLLQRQVPWQIILTKVRNISQAFGFMISFRKRDRNYCPAPLSTTDTTNYWLLLVQCDLLTPEGVAQSLIAVREDLDQMLLGVHRKANVKSAEDKSKRAAASRSSGINSEDHGEGSSRKHTTEVERDASVIDIDSVNNSSSEIGKYVRTTLAPCPSAF